MANQKYDYLFKIVVIGSSDVGKTNLVKRFTKGEFEPAKKQTVIEFYEKIVPMHEKQVKAQIWDIGGQQSSIRHFYRGAWGFLIVYSVDNRESFEKAKSFLDDVKKATSQEKGANGATSPTFGRSPVAIMFVGNKSDLTTERVVSTEEAKQYAETQNVLFMETSAQNNKDDAQTLFDKLLQVIFKTSSFEKAYGNALDPRDSLEMSPTEVRKQTAPEVKLETPPQDVAMKRVGSTPTLDSIQHPSVHFEDSISQSERVYGNLFQSVYGVLGQMIYGATCSSAVEVESFARSVTLFIPRLIMYLLLFVLHFVMLIFVILPFAFWYLALRGANKIFRLKAMEPGRSIQAQRFHFFAKIIPMNIFLFIAPIFFINSLIPMWKGQAASTASSVTLGIHLAALFLIQIVATIRRFQVAPEPSTEPQSKSGFNYTNPQNWVIFAAMLFEGLSMLAWPLQQPDQSGTMYPHPLDDMTHRAFPAFFLTLPYTSYDRSYAIALSVVFGLLALLTIQIMRDIKMYTMLVFAGKTEDANEFYTYSFVGSCMYGHGQLKYASPVICALFVIFADAMFLQVSNQLLSTIACSTDGVWLNNTSLQCWEAPQKGIATISFIMFEYFIFICVLFGPQFIQRGFGENDIKFTQLYLRIVTICKSFMVIHSTFWALRAASSMIASSMVTSAVLLMVTFSWTVTNQDNFLHTPCSLPFINMFKCSIYLTSFWAGAIAAATTITFTGNQETKFNLVLAGILIDIFVLVVCYAVYHYNHKNPSGRKFSQVDFSAEHTLEMGTR